MPSGLDWPTKRIGTVRTKTLPRIHHAAFLLVSLFGPQAAFASSVDSVEAAGDALQILLPLSALGIALLSDHDKADTTLQLNPPERPSFWADALPASSTQQSPLRQLLMSLGRTYLTTYGFKFGIDAERPNGGGESFPSGHTALAFAGAGFIYRQRGWTWGAPAALAAGFVGWSRVESEHHYWRDVLAGAAIGWGSNFLGNRLPWGQGYLEYAPSWITPLDEGWGAPGLTLRYSW